MYTVVEESDVPSPFVDNPRSGASAEPVFRYETTDGFGARFRKGTPVFRCSRETRPNRVFLGPLFFPLDISDPLGILAESVMFLTLGLYYYCWIRYFRSRKRLYLFSPLLSIPVPMAVFPVIYFLLSAVILDSLPVFLGGLVLAAGHVPISYLHYRALVKPS
jgi:hypothetical protein